MAALAALLFCACEGPPGNPLPEGDWRSSSGAVLDRLGESHTPARALAASGERGRFSDVPQAAYWAVAEDGVEMGIGQTIETETGYVFHMKTVEGWPATLTVDRAEGDRVYEAAATVGRFPDLPERRARSDRLVEAFDRYMTDFGRKPSLGGD